MASVLRRALALLLAVLTVAVCCPLTARAEVDMAREISGPALVADHRGDKPIQWLFDGNTVKGYALYTGYYLTLEHEEGIGSLYLIFNEEYGPYTITNNDTGETAMGGESRMLHEFLDLEAIFGTAPRSVSLHFDSGPLRLNELSAYTVGQVPDSVQRWEQPADGQTDLVLFSAHGDDEQIFFAGLLPYYAGELGYQVQVVYLTNHRNVDRQRAHEMLNGLWAVGVRSYPVFGTFGDYLTTTKDKAYSSFAYMGVSKEQLLGFVVEQLRRFKPKVAVGHDLINGEYGHGAHMLYADLLCKALEISNDPEQYPELAEQYGVWDVPKTYLHLYPENEIVMDWDRPLERFGGKTAFQVTRDIGFAYHWSQQIAFGHYITPYDSALEMPYSPAYYGLYRSTVGEDVQKNDLFENLMTYAEEAWWEAEWKTAVEELDREKERQRLEAEEQARAEEEARLAREQQQEEAALPQTQESAPSQPQEKKDKPIGYLALSVMALSFTGLVLMIILLIRRKRRHKKYF